MPDLSIIIILHNMVRESRRTLYTLSPAYQQNVQASDYDVLVLDNGSTEPVDTQLVESFGPNFKYMYFETDSVSPVEAINYGVAQSNSKYVAIIVDGARMVTPGMIANSLTMLKAFKVPLICTLAWHLGPDVQNKSMLKGYNQSVEDKLLETIDWRADGYELFKISAIAQSSQNGFLNGLPGESSWLAMARDMFLTLGGFDVRFTSPGGGFMNHQFLADALALPAVSPVLLLGEGSFHQFHGGVATNVQPAEHPRYYYLEEYRKLFGNDFVKPEVSTVFWKQAE